MQLRLAKCEDRLARLTDAFVDQLIDKELFEARKRAVFSARQQLADELKTLSVSDLPANRAYQNLELGNVAYSGFKSGNTAERREWSNV